MGSEVSCCTEAIKRCNVSDDETDDEQFLGSEHKLIKNCLHITKPAPISLEPQQKNNKTKRSKHKKRKRPRSRSDNKYFQRMSEYTPLIINSTHNTPSIGSSDSQITTDGMSPLSTLSDNHAHIILSYSDCSFPISMSCKSRSFSVPIIYSNSSLDNLIEEEHIQCDCVDNCMAIKRVINALKTYSKYISKPNILIDKYQNDTELINDYQHILDCHLSQQYNINMGMEYTLIQHNINKQIKKCDIHKCDGYQRYTQSKKQNKYGDSIADFMDSMHCFLIHSNDKYID
eukprot:350935_1